MLFERLEQNSELACVRRTCDVFAKYYHEKLICESIAEVPNPNYDLLSFDNIVWAMLMVWQIFTHDMWVRDFRLEQLEISRDRILRFIPNNLIIEILLENVIESNELQGSQICKCRNH